MLIGNNSINNAKIRIDGQAKHDFVEAAKYIRKEVPTGTIYNLKFLDSHSEPLIQLADMVSGVIGKTYNKPESESVGKLLGYIQLKIENIWVFGG